MQKKVTGKDLKRTTQMNESTKTLIKYQFPIVKSGQLTFILKAYLPKF